MGRHRHVTCVRTDGLSTVLASLLEDRRVVAATLVDLGSGFILDACTREGDLADLDLLGAGHADLMRSAPAITGEKPGAAATLTVETADGRVHLLREIPDPHGERLVLAVVVAGSPRSVVRARQRLAAVPIEALTAGPTLQRRPVDGRWLIGPTSPVSPAVTPEGLPGLEPVVPTAGLVPDPVDPVVGETPAAMVPVVVTSDPDTARWADDGAESTFGDWFAAGPENAPDPEFGPRPDPGEDDVEGDAGAGGDPDIPSPRGEPAGADV